MQFRIARMKNLKNILMFALILLVSCRKDFEPTDGFTDVDGVTLEIVPSHVTIIETRGGQNEDSRVDHVQVYVFDTAQKLLHKAQQDFESPSFNGNYRMHMMLPSNQTCRIYAVCNLPELWGENITTESELENYKLESLLPECAFVGSMVMSGKREFKSAEIQNKKQTLLVPVSRIAAKINFKVSFQPEVKTDKFYLSCISVCNVPLKSWLMERTENQVGHTSNGRTDLMGAEGDAVHDPALTTFPVPEGYKPPKGLYFDESQLQLIRERVKDEAGNDILWTTASTYLFENRRGEKRDKSFFTSRFGNRQGLYSTLKGELARQEHPNASYLMVEGIYESDKGLRTKEVKYKIYIGRNNFSNFNVTRNSRFDITSVIKAVDNIDTRVDIVEMNKSSITEFFKTPLDAHFGTGTCFGYTQNKSWELFVENPDQCPWLEISFSADYKPHTMGQQLTDKEKMNIAGTYFSSDKKALSQYFYIHVDEFIPETAATGSNDNISASGTNIALDPASWRKGVVVLRDRVNHTEARFEVTQRPAQLVRLVSKDSRGNTARHDYYVEFEAETTPIVWGFLRYGANPVMTSMINDRWDGLSNTRKLYQEAVKLGGAYNPQIEGGVFGEKKYKYATSEEAAAHLPQDEMIGYVMTKNRDRNGNGCIDYDEIEWYVPAANELLELCKVFQRGELVIGQGESRFYSSTPYLAGYSAEVPGRAFYVKKENGKYQVAFVMRDHRYFVICCRRKNAWTGVPDSGADGNISIDPGWNPDENDIIPKNE